MKTATQEPEASLEGRARPAHRTGLRSSEAIFSKAFHASPAIMTISTLKDFRCIEVNRAFEERSGYTREEVLERSVIEIGLWEDCGELLRVHRRLLEQGGIRDIQARFRTRSGEVRVGLLSAEVIEFEGEPCVLAVVEDVTDRTRAEEALRESERRYHELFESSADAIMILDRWGIIDCNAATLRMFSCSSKEELLALHPAEISPGLQPDGAESRAAADHRIADAFRCGTQRFEWTLRRRTGEDFPAEIWLTAFILAGQQILQATVRDISQRKQDESRLRLVGEIFANTAEGVVVTDAAGTIQSVNFAFEEITGYSAREAIGQNPRILKSGRQDDEFYAGMWRTLLATGKWTGEFWNRRKNGEIYLQESKINAIRDERGVVIQYAAIFSDVTERHNLEERLRVLSSTDGLTGLSNRRVFDEMLDEEWRRAQRVGSPLAVVMIDIDHFKAYNDHLGHQAGDECLKGVGRAIRNGVHRAGDRSARYGGEEFVLLLPATDAADAARVAQRVRAAVEALRIPHPDGGGQGVVTVSLGVAAAVPHRGASPLSLVESADRALYRAKHEGRNRVVGG